MADDALLTDEFLRQLMNVGEVDILIGLPTHNNAATVKLVVQTLQAGILQSFPRERSVIINADGGSQDGTRDIVTSASINDVWSASKAYTLRSFPAISTQYARVPEPGTALRTILAAADLLRAKTCVMFSAELTTIDQSWLGRLVSPVLRGGFDLVAPIYRRQRSEGLLMRNLLYPMVRAIYGRDIREPYASEFAVSSGLATNFMNQTTWHEEWGKAGAEICLTIAAITGTCKVCQTHLGAKPPQPANENDLVLAMRRTVGALFSRLDGTFDSWSSISTPEATPSFGEPPDIPMEPVRINRKRLREMFVQGVSELQPLFRSILSETALADLQQIASLENGNFRYPNELWARTVLEFAASYHKSIINRDHIIQALVPLFRGRALSFLLQHRESSSEDIERDVESLCAEFERQKPYLLELWDRK